MEINSSPVNILPNGISSSLTGKLSTAPEKNRQDGLALNQDEQGNNQQSPQSPEQIRSTLDDAGLSADLSNDNSQGSQQNTPNFRSLKAIDAYTTTVNQPKIELRDNLIVGVDFYV